MQKFASKYRTAMCVLAEYADLCLENTLKAPALCRRAVLQEVLG